MKRSTDRILTTHSGSLPRPRELAELLLDRADNKPVDKAKFDALARQSVADTVRKQVEAGVTVVNDGETAKVSYAAYLKDRLNGFEELEDVQYRSRARAFLGEAEQFPEYSKRKYEFRSMQLATCVGPISWKDFWQVERDIDNLKSAVASHGGEIAETFMSAAAPTVASGRQPNKYYKTMEEYQIALADTLKREYQAIVDAGLLLQVDFPEGVFSRNFKADTDVKEHRKKIEKDVEMLNYSIAGIPSDRIRIHMCWGHSEGAHTNDIELRHCADLLMKIKADGLTLVGANARHDWEWQVWKDVKKPDEKVICIGVIDQTTNTVEHPETVAQRLERYASVMGRESVIAGVDCGFSTFVGEEPRVDHDIVWAKLRSMAQGAEIASKRLWK